MYSIRLKDVMPQGIAPAELNSMLKRAGVSSNDYALRDGKLMTTNLGVAEAVNRIRAFHNKSESLPFIVIEAVTDSGAKGTYVTQDPWKLKKDLQWNELIVHVTSESAIDAIASKKVNPTSEFMAMDRHQLGAAFDKNGTLRNAKRGLDRNPDFIYALIKKGFYVYRADESGKLCIR